MTREEIEQFKQRAYRELKRYMANAEAALEKAGKDGEEWYHDSKYVESASGTAYLAAIHACDDLFILSGVLLVLEEEPKEGKKKGKKQRPRIRDYMRAVEKLGRIVGDPLLTKKFHTIYNNLHLGGYYEGNCDIRSIRRAFELVYELIELLRPDNPLPPLPPKKPDGPFVSAVRQVVAMLTSYLP